MRRAHGRVPVQPRHRAGNVVACQVIARMQLQYWALFSGVYGLQCMGCMINQDHVNCWAMHGYSPQPISRTHDRDEAAAAEMMRNTGRTRSMLDGIPLALKGNWALKGVPLATQRTGLLRNFTPSASATLVSAAQTTPAAWAAAAAAMMLHCVRACLHASPAAAT